MRRRSGPRFVDLVVVDAWYPDEPLPKAVFEDLGWPVVALLWVKLIAFTRFHAFAILHGTRLRLGLATLGELLKQLHRSLLCGQPILFFRG